MKTTIRADCVTNSVRISIWIVHVCELILTNVIRTVSKLSVDRNHFERDKWTHIPNSSAVKTKRLTELDILRVKIISEIFVLNFMHQVKTVLKRD